MQRFFARTLTSSSSRYATRLLGYSSSISLWNTRRMSSQEPESKTNDDSFYMSGKDAAQLDVDLMDKNGKYQYEEPQLMELAGLSVASVIMDAYSNKHLSNTDKCEKALVLAGPGNNGGDGLVAARHLKLFGIYDPVVYYPLKDKPKKPFYVNLLKQCEAFQIEVIKDFPSEQELATYKLFIDAVFGYSFKGPLRGQWKEHFPVINKVCAANNIPIVAVDVPSGWNIDEGPHEQDICLDANILVSLSAPKKCSKDFKGIHYLGGRFMPQQICDRFKLKLPKYPGSAQCVRIDRIDSHL